MKLCDRLDFDDQEVRDQIHDIVPGLDSTSALARKYWEYAMLALFLRDVGALRDDADLLAVGAGQETPLFWLANHVRRIVATDVYGTGDFKGAEGAADMLVDPASLAPYPYREDRLEVRWMDARELQFPDQTFDAVFSLSSIEHFGDRKEIARASAEIGRVLKPGGHAFIVTECFIGRHVLDSPLVQTAVRLATLGRRCTRATPRRRIIDVFTAPELNRRIISPSGLSLMQPLRTDLSTETFENVIRMHQDGRLEPATGRPTPHIVLRGRGAPWTSVALALERAAPEPTGGLIASL